MNRTRTGYRPGVETCETRELLSGMAALIASSAPHAPAVTASLLEARSAAANPTVTATSTGGLGSVGTSDVPLLGSGTPTARELARDRFRAYFSGPVLVGPGRFTDQAKITLIRGIGGSSAFLHGDLSLGIITPTDPNAPFTGVAVMQDKNQSAGAVLGLDVTGSRTDVDRFGRPTKLTFNSDPSIYGGAFFATSSTGTVTIRYQGTRAVARFDGYVFTNGLSSPLKNSAALANGGFN